MSSSRVAWSVVTALVLLESLAPLAWLVSLSLKPAAELSSGRLLPDAPTLTSYAAVLGSTGFARAIVNSLGIVGIATVITIVLATLAAYAIVRLALPGGRVLLLGALAIALFPQITLVGALFDLWLALGLYDTWAGLIVPYVALGMPLALWSLTAFLRDLPWELEDAARTEGASRSRSLMRVMLPLAAPGVAATAVLVFILAWNDLLLAISLTSTARARTAPAALAFFSGASRFEQPIGTMAAAAVIVSIPVVVLVLLFQRRIVAGLTGGALKG